MTRHRNETAAEHVRNALTLLHLEMETAETTLGNEGPGVVVPMKTLAAVTARLEAALDQIPPSRPALPFPARRES